MSGNDRFNSWNTWKSSHSRRSPNARISCNSTWYFHACNSFSLILKKKKKSETFMFAYLFFYWWCVKTKSLLLNRGILRLRTICVAHCDRVEVLSVEFWMRDMHTKCVLNFSLFHNDGVCLRSNFMALLLSVGRSRLRWYRLFLVRAWIRWFARLWIISLSARYSLLPPHMRACAHAIVCSMDRYTAIVEAFIINNNYNNELNNTSWTGSKMRHCIIKRVCSRVCACVWKAYSLGRWKNWCIRLNFRTFAIFGSNAFSARFAEAASLPSTQCRFTY